MPKNAIVPPSFAAASNSAKMSPAIRSGDFIFVTGMAGGDLDGVMPQNPKIQFRNAFEKIGQVLKEANIGFDAIVEMTTYHINLQKHFEDFDKIRLDYFSKPYPAWTAVEVAGLRREGALAEIRVIATTA